MTLRSRAQKGKLHPLEGKQVTATINQWNDEAPRDELPQVATGMHVCRRVTTPLVPAMDCVKCIVGGFDVDPATIRPEAIDLDSSATSE